MGLHYFDESIVELSIECKHKCNICNKSFACIQHIFYRIVHEWLIQTCWRHFSDGASTIKGGHMIYPQSFKVSLMHTNFASLAKQQGLKRTSSPHVLNFFHRHWEPPAFFCQKMSKEVGERKKHRKTLEIMILLLLLRRQRRRHSTRKHGFLLRVLYSALKWYEIKCNFWSNSSQMHAFKFWMS